VLRNILTVLGVVFIAGAIQFSLRGELSNGLAVRTAIYVILVILLWVPPRMAYRLKPLRDLDKRMFKYDWFRQLLRAIVGQKEYSEMERILHDVHNS
jgi:uncharacterized membrane protein YhaH (DUF805 family)